jgi:hypothetical protein
MKQIAVYRAMRPHVMGLALVAGLALAACGSRPPIPDWQINAQGAAQRATEAYLSGNERVATAEWQRARSEVARTGRPELLARLELMHCAAQGASLALAPGAPCEGFEALRTDAEAPERAYADYLAGHFAAVDAAQLPPVHRQVLAAGEDPGAALAAMADPLARMVAAGALLQAGRAGPTVLVQASETASAQGWRRPLLAWLLVRVQRAEQAGATQEAERLRRQVAVVEGLR